MKKRRKHCYIVKVTAPVTKVHFEFNKGTDLEWAKELKKGFEEIGFKGVICVR